MPRLTWCVQRLVGSPACATSSAVDEPNRLLCAERGDHPVRRVRQHHRQHHARGPEPRRHPRRLDRGGTPPAGRSPRPARVPHLRRARRPPRDRRRAGRGRHRAHLRDPGADSAAGLGRRGRHWSGAHGHGQDPRLRRAAAAACHRTGRAARRRCARRSRRPHQGRSAGAGRGAHPRTLRAGGEGPRRRRREARHPGHCDLRGSGLRTAARGAAEGRRRGGRHAGPAAGPRRAAPSRARPRQGARAGRGRRDAGPGLPARRRAHHADASRAAAHDAVLGHDARADHRALAGVPEPAHAHPCGGGRPGLHPREHHAAGLPRARDGQGRAAHPRAAGEGPRAHHDLRADQAHRAAGRRRPRRPRIRRRRRARRPGPGRSRAGAARVPLGQGRRSGGHGRRGPRHRRDGRHPRRELPVPRGRQDLRPPDRPHRPGRQDRRRGDPRRLGRAPQVEDDQRRPRARHAGGTGDLLHVAAPLQRPRDPRRRQGPPAALAAHPGGPGRRVRRHRGRPRRAPASRPATASADAATMQCRPTRRGRHVSARPGPAAAAECCSRRTGRRWRPR